MKIGWVKIKSRNYGEAFYEGAAQKVLADNFDLDLVEVDSHRFKRGYLRAPELLFNLLRVGGQKDLWIRGFYPTITMPFDKTRGKSLVIVHHIDFSQSSGLAKVIDWLIEKAANFGLERATAILTVSDFWKDYFIDKGFKNVYRIYNSFNLEDFNVSEAEVEEFKKKYNLSGKPIVYLGNCQKDKGVVEAFEALKDLDVHLVTSGYPFCNISALNFDLEHADYRKLLKASSVALAMSKVKEGWGRTAHEAMLSGTPVIGSGLGGMRELLEGGGQIICQDFSSLREKVEYLLANPGERENMGKAGFSFARNFTPERFKQDWLNLIQELNK